MRHKQLIMLFICHSIPPVVGMGLFPILPLYVAEFGATPSMIGLYFAVLSIASLSAALATSRLAARFSHKHTFVAAGVAGVLALILLARATALWHVVVLTALLWFVGGVILNLVKVLTGQIGDSANHGTFFSLLFLSYPIGAIIGGVLIGQLVAYKGYPFMFTMLGVGWSFLPIIGFAGLNTPPTRAVTMSIHTRPQRQGMSFVMLLVAALLSNTALNISRLNSSLVMQVHSFPAHAIASTGVVAGFGTILVLLALGRLSDWMGHRRLLVTSYGLALIGMLVLSAASQLWQFQLAATLLSVAWCANGSATSALTAELLPADALDRALPRVNAMENIAGIVGCAGAGWLMESVSEQGMLVIVAPLVLVSFQLVALLQGKMRVAFAKAQPESSVPAQLVEVAQP